MKTVARYGAQAVKRYPAVRKRYNVYAPAVKQLASDVMYLKGLINTEPFHFSTVGGGNFDYNGVILSLNNISQGDGPANRTGCRILPRYYHLRFHINKDTAGQMHNTFRYILFRWWGESPNTTGAAPAPNEILDATTIGTVYAPLATLSNDITGSKGDRNRRIEVHRSGAITLDCVSKSCFDFDENIILNGSNNAPKEHIEYYGSSAAPPTSGGFFLLLISDKVNLTDLSYTLYSNLTYYDN